MLASAGHVEVGSQHLFNMVVVVSEADSESRSSHVALAFTILQRH